MNVDVLLMVSFLVIGAFGSAKLVKSLSSEKTGDLISCEDCEGCEACCMKTFTPAIEKTVKEPNKRKTSSIDTEAGTIINNVIINNIVNNVVNNDIGAIDKLLASVLDKLSHQHSASQYMELTKQRTQLEAVKLAFNQQKLLGGI